MADATLPAIEIVGFAAKGNDAVSLFKATHPQVVTMHLIMPEMDGVECTRLLTELDSNVKILIIAALSDKASAIQALKNGAQGFLYKPFTDAELVNALLEIIEKCAI